MTTSQFGNEWRQPGSATSTDVSSTMRVRVDCGDWGRSSVSYIPVIARIWPVSTLSVTHTPGGLADVDLSRQSTDVATMACGPVPTVDTESRERVFLVRETIRGPVWGISGKFFGFFSGSFRALQNGDHGPSRVDH
jgi:hypothetical protein